jgi:hypothetical protein
VEYRGEQTNIIRTSNGFEIGAVHSAHPIMVDVPMHVEAGGGRLFVYNEITAAAMGGFPPIAHVERTPADAKTDGR